MSRGKTDKLDAERTAEYAYRFRDKVNIWKPASNEVRSLKKLQTKRDLLVKVQTQLKQALEGKEDEDFPAPMLAEDIRSIGQKLDDIIASDHELRNQNELLQSILGVGRVLSVSLITITQGFTTFDNPRKLSSYAGIAPFPYQSGKSINDRDRVSKLGNQRLKKLLNLAAWNAIRSLDSLKNYYEKKVNEGKAKLSAINGVKTVAKP